jgi:hypothetical protein
MAADVQNGGQISKSITFEFVNFFCVLSFAMNYYFDQKHDLKPYFVKLAKNGESIQDGDQNLIFQHKSWSFQYFFILLFAFVWCKYHLFCGKKLFLKFKVAEI